jgi:hypothetical protein
MATNSVVKYDHSYLTVDERSIRKENVARARVHGGWQSGGARVSMYVVCILLTLLKKHKPLKKEKHYEVRDQLVMEYSTHTGVNLSYWTMI